MRVAILESSPDVRVAIASLLRDAPDVEVVRHARTLAEFVDARRDSVDVLVADLHGLGGDSRAAMGDLRERFPRIRVVVTSTGEEREYGDAVADLLADAWVPKTRLAGELLPVLRRLAADTG